MSDAPLLSIVIPAHGEAEHLERSLASIRASATTLKIPFEIVVIDDGSPDNTWPVLERLAERMPELRCASLTRCFGKEAAILAGLDIAQGAAVVLMDSDLQHPPELIPEMFKLWRDDHYKVVNGVKRHRGREPLVIALGAKLFNALFERLVRTRFAGSSDFKLLDRQVVDVYRHLPERSTFFRGLMPWLGFRQTQVTYEVQARLAGDSKWSFSKRVSLATNAIVSFSTIPLRLVTISGGLFLVFAVILAADTLYNKFAGIDVEGFATVILLTLIVGSILMLSLGIIGEYLAKIYEEVKGRPRYLIKNDIRADGRRIQENRLERFQLVRNRPGAESR